jgi:hypothetical protein
MAADHDRKRGAKPKPRSLKDRRRVVEERSRKIRLEKRAIEIFQEIEWRMKCQQSLVEFAGSVPIPGVPVTDNYEQRLANGTLEHDGEYDWEFDDDRYDNNLHISKITTPLARHHILLLELAQDVIEGNLMAPDGTICRRGMAFMPPGSAKSTYWSVVTPAWVMGKYPGEPIILTSYADLLAKKHGKRARQLVQTPEYKAVFETGLDPNTKAANQWALENGSEYLAAGLQSGLTGNRAFGLIWDDPIKGRRAAESLAEQNNTWDAYRDDARTRKTPHAWELGVMTRWAEKDLAGRILPEDWAGESGFFKGQDGNWWKVLCLQAEVETDTDPLGRKPGEFLWTEWFNLEGDPAAYWAPFKLDARSWASLYQQVPTPPEGAMFKQDWVKIYDRAPKRDDVNVYISADYAVTADDDASNPDMTAIAIWGIDSQDRIYFLDGWHGQVDAGAWTETVIDFFEAWKPMVHVAGGGPIRRGTEPFLRKRMEQRKVMCRLEWLPETFSKEENARSFQALMSMGQVYWPNTEEAQWWIRHLIGFPTLRYLDPVDACSMLGRWVARMWMKDRKKVEETPPVISAGEIPVSNLMPRDMMRAIGKRNRIG